MPVPQRLAAGGGVEVGVGGDDLKLFHQSGGGVVGGVATVEVVAVPFQMVGAVDPPSLAVEREPLAAKWVNPVGKALDDLYGSVCLH